MTVITSSEKGAWCFGIGKHHKNGIVKTDERLEIIIREVQEHGQIRVSEISKMLGCSEVTIRNDIRKLDEQGVVKKTYGGAAKIESGLSVQFIAGEYYLNADRKSKIARKAYDYIEDQDSILIDDSTTCCYLAHCIRDNPQKQLTVVTNSVYVAAELSTTRHVRVYVLGGQITSYPASTVDGITADSIERYHANKFFTGINRINLEFGMTSEDAEHAEVKRRMISKAEETYVLADHSKFGCGRLFTVCGMDQVTCVITDAGVSREIVALASRLKIHMDVV